MYALLHIFVLLICIVTITKGATWLVDSSVAIAHRLGVSELFIGLTIVAFSTSAPEFGVTTLAAFKGMGNISIGNIIGSNLFNLGFILGGIAIIQNLQINKKNLWRDGMFLFIGSILLTTFLWDLSLSHFEGVILFALLSIYIGYLFWKKESLKPETHRIAFHWWNPLLFIIGLGMVLGGSHFLVESAITLSEMIGISELVIGTTIVAAGTSIPELVTSLTAALRGHHSISVGNLIGSDIFNMYGVMGITAILRQLPVENGARPNMIVLIIMIIIVLVLMRTQWTISRKEGYALVAIGLIRLFLNFSPILSS